MLGAQGLLETPFLIHWSIRLSEYLIPLQTYFDVFHLAQTIHTLIANQSSLPPVFNRLASNDDNWFKLKIEDILQKDELSCYKCNHYMSIMLPLCSMRLPNCVWCALWVSTFIGHTRPARGGSMAQSIRPTVPNHQPPPSVTSGWLVGRSALTPSWHIRSCSTASDKMLGTLHNFLLVKSTF